MGIVDIRTGKPIAAPTFTRRKVLGGLAGILATGAAPAAFVRSAIGARTAAWGGEKSPYYDYRVQYLETAENTATSADAAFDLDFVPSNTSRMVLDMQIPTVNAYCGCAYSPDYRFGIGGHMTETGMSMWWETDKWRSDTVTAEIANRRMLVDLDGENGIVKYGSYYTNTSAGKTKGSTGINLRIFGCTYQGGVDPGSKFNSRIYGVKLYTSGTLVRDYIFVMKNNAPYAFDTVHKTMVARSGTLPFIIGPRV